MNILLYISLSSLTKVQVLHSQSIFQDQNHDLNFIEYKLFITLYPNVKHKKDFFSGRTTPSLRIDAFCDWLYNFYQSKLTIMKDHKHFHAFFNKLTKVKLYNNLSDIFINTKRKNEPVLFNEFVIFINALTKYFTSVIFDINEVMDCHLYLFFYNHITQNKDLKSKLNHNKDNDLIMSLNEVNFIDDSETYKSLFIDKKVKHIFLVDLQFYTYTFLQSYLKTKKFIIKEFELHIEKLLITLISFEHYAFENDKQIYFIYDIKNFINETYYNYYNKTLMSYIEFITICNNLFSLYMEIEAFDYCVSKNKIQDLYDEEIFKSRRKMFFKVLNLLLEKNQYETTDLKVSAVESKNKKIGKGKKHGKYKK